MRRKNLRTTLQVQAHYEQNVVEYDRVRFGTKGGQYVNERELEFVASILKGSKVLEVGTATGRFAEQLTERGAEYTGVDLSKKMLRATLERTNHSASVFQMDGACLGFLSIFDYALCIRTFHFLLRPVEALQNMFTVLKPSGHCLVTFETDNFLRRLILLFGIGTSEQHYYKISDVQPMFEKAGFKVTRGGSVMRIPVTLYRKCPGPFLPLLKRLEQVWPWSMHQYILATK